MEILGIGPLEIVLVLVLALVILGPKGMVDMGRKIGRWTRSFVRSPLWKDITTAQREVSDLPRKLVREAGIDEVKASLRQTGQEASQSIHGLSREITADPVEAPPENNILPPAPPPPDPDGQPGSK